MHGELWSQECLEMAGEAAQQGNQRMALAWFEEADMIRKESPNHTEFTNKEEKLFASLKQTIYEEKQMERITL